jgi:hypothetical protein
MSFETLKDQVDALTDSERRRLMAYLVAVEDAKVQDHAARMAEKIDDNTPGRWFTLEDIEKRYKSTEPGS